MSRAVLHRAAGPVTLVGGAVEGAGAGVGQSRITTAETLFFGDPSMSLSE